MTSHTTEKDERASDAAHSDSESDSTTGGQDRDRQTESEWDAEIEKDAKAGKLDDLIQEAREAHRKGETTPLP